MLITKIKAVEIQWDTDGIDPNNFELPTEMDIPDGVVSDVSDTDLMLYEISDYISDETGFCHNGFKLELQ